MSRGKRRWGRFVPSASRSAVCSAQKVLCLRGCTWCCPWSVFPTLVPLNSPAERVCVGGPRERSTTKRIVGDCPTLPGPPPSVRSAWRARAVAPFSSGRR